MTTPNYFKLPSDGLPGKLDLLVMKFPEQGVAWNECVDLTAQKDWFLCEEEMAEILWQQDQSERGIMDFVPYLLKDTMPENQKYFHALANAIAAFGAHLLKPRKD